MLSAARCHAERSEASCGAQHRAQRVVMLSGAKHLAQRSIVRSEASYRLLKILRFAQDAIHSAQDDRRGAQDAMRSSDASAQDDRQRGREVSPPGRAGFVHWLPARSRAGRSVATRL